MVDLTGIGSVATAAKDILGMIFPNKTEEEKAQLAAALALIQSQTDIDKAEAQSSDPLQHWRGGMGWVCVAGYGYNFVLRPLIVAMCAISSHPIQLPELDLTQLATITIGMLGLGGLHVAERIKGVA